MDENGSVRKERDALIDTVGRTVALS